jgi:alkanesulfonate monooxygenase SsuD/methylene tetrahydromethanopterin reductase-like flavin-dependent oxidoreductase (luciferase family)
MDSLNAVELGVNVPNFGPGTNPGRLRDWARTVEGLGYDLLMVSDHVAITPDVEAQYPAPFYEPFTTLSWLGGVTDRIRLGTTVLIAPYRHPLLTARMAANLDQLSGGRLVLGVGVGWARQEFEALGADFDRRGDADRDPARLGERQGLRRRPDPDLDRRPQYGRTAPSRPPRRRLAPAPGTDELVAHGNGSASGHRRRGGAAGAGVRAADPAPADRGAAAGRRAGRG